MYAAAQENDLPENATNDAAKAGTRPPSRCGGLALFVSLLVTTGLLAAFAWSNVEQPFKAVMHRADFSVRDASGDRVRLTDLTRKGPALLVFGGSPSDVEAVAAATRGEQVALVFTRQPDTESAIVEGVRLLIDADGSLARTFGAIDFEQTPRAVLVSSEGRVLFTESLAALADQIRASAG